MKNVRCMLAIAIVMLVIDLKAQNPGGVAGYTIWFKNSKHIDEIDLERDTPAINYQLPIALENGVKVFHEGNSKSTAFLVFRSKENKEHTVLESRFKNSKYRITNKNIFVSKSKHQEDSVQYLGGDPESGVIACVSQEIYSDFIAVKNISISKKLEGRNNISKKSDILEYIYYPRLLDSAERMRIATYLSLKFGISLVHDSYYAGSLGETIWNPREFASYNFDVSGIGRDSGSVLKIQQAKNTKDQVLETWIGERKKINILNNYPSIDGFYFLYGHNNNGLVFSDDSSSGVKILKRKWKIENTKHLGDQIKVNYLFRGKNLFQHLPENGDKIWLIVGKSEDIMGSPFERFEGRKLNNNELQIDSVAFNWTNTDILFFTLMTGPDLLVLTERQRDCGKAFGDYNVHIEGGTSPYRIEFHRKDGRVFEYLSENKIRQIEGIPDGEYTFRVEDRFGHVFIKPEYNYQDWKCLDVQIDSVISLNDQGFAVLHFDHTVSSGIIKNYKWVIDNHTLGENKNVIIDKPGKYTLNISGIKGETISKELTVVTNNTRSDWQIFPSPASVNSTIFIEFDNSHISGDFQFFTLSGELIRPQINNISKTKISTEFKIPGVYYVNVKIDGVIQTKSLVVQ